MIQTIKNIQSNEDKTKPVELRIIIIDDNPAIHQDFIKILSPVEKKNELDSLEEKLFGTQGKSDPALPKFYINSASQGQEGLEKIKEAIKAGTPYALAFVDIRMPPGWDGVETIKRIWEVDQNIQIVICTAYSDYTWEETIAELGTSENLLILKKPFDNTAVRQLAASLTKKWLLMKEVQNHTIQLEKSIEERTHSLRHSLSLSRSTLESSNDGIVVIDNNGKVVDYNKRFVELWNISPTTIASKNFDVLIEHMTKQLKDSKTYLNKINKLNTNHDGTSLDTIYFNDNRIYEQYTQPQKLEEKTIGRVWSFRDVTKRVQLEKKLEQQATHDALTGLPNRLLLLDRVQHAIDKAKRYNQKFAVMFCDLDRFKLVNDSLSHQAGDDLLKAVAGRLRKTLREEDTIARQGGDEFVIVINGFKKDSEAEKIAKKILTQLKKPFNISNRKIVIGSSIGISYYPTDGTTTSELLSNADLAMYRAKGLGGNQFQHYTSELNQESTLRLDLEHELREALDNKEFFLCYQPQFNLHSKKIIAVEALIRWNHPKNGLTLPMDFIPIAEETGLIVQIGEWILREACRQNKDWQDKGIGFFRVGVNIASQQLKFSKFTKTVKDILKETELDPQYLELEITENVIIAHPEVTRTINEISGLGVKISLDDFGTGNSTLSSLTKVHIDRLKIDQSFIQNINVDKSDEVIIKAIVDMSHSLNYEVLAEGVETQKQVDFLKDKNCEMIQGFLFGIPLNHTDLEKEIRKSNSYKEK